MVEGRPFRRELRGWLLRGGVCAVPSAWGALGAIPPGVAMVAGMLTGFTLVVAAFTAACSRLDADGPPWGRALRIAAWIKAGLSLGPGLFLDAITGGLCMGTFRAGGAQSAVGTFALVLVTTLAQGMLVAFEVFLLGTVLLLSGVVRR